VRHSMVATPFAVLGFMLFMPRLEKWAVRT
jgi:hypothetical protein